MKLNSTLVALTSCPDYARQSLADSINQTMVALDQVPDLHSCNIVLKPNLITGGFGILPCSEPAFMLAVTRWFIDQGAKVRIGDSPALGTATSVLQKLNVADKLTSLGAEITDFKQSRIVRLSGGGRATVAVEAMDCDLLINLPRVKAHAQTRLTLAVKNCFGTLIGMRKPWWHMIYGGKSHGEKGCTFNDRIVQLLEVLADSVTIVDGITAMDKTGPIHGEPYALGLIGASTNPVALDRSLHEILSIAPEQSPIMSACQRAGLSGSKLLHLSFPLLSPLELQVTDFQVPAELNPIRFNPFRFVKNSVRRVLSFEPGA